MNSDLKAVKVLGTCMRNHLAGEMKENLQLEDRRCEDILEKLFHQRGKRF